MRKRIKFKMWIPTPQQQTCQLFKICDRQTDKDAFLYSQTCTGMNLRKSKKKNPPLTLFAPVTDNGP